MYLLLLFFTYSHKFNKYSIAQDQLCFILRSVACGILKNCKWREQTLNFKCVAFRVWTRQRMFSKVFTSTTSMIAYVLPKRLIVSPALQSCVFKETIGLSQFSNFSRILSNAKEKELKFSQTYHSRFIELFSMQYSTMYRPRCAHILTEIHIFWYENKINDDNYFRNKYSCKA